ncbi:MAG: hypothetical protein HYX85_02845 [Chloroflexi bacterium]|nr:hypothetical protein [Chloroflexota bacterium]
MPPVVYSIKVDRSNLYKAKKFFLRAQLPLQDALRAHVKMAADCEQCLELVEAKAPVEEIQSALAGILADAKETFRLNGLFRSSILKIAEASKLPEDFIPNVLAEAERIQNSRAAGKSEGGAPEDNGPTGTHGRSRR